MTDSGDHRREREIDKPLGQDAGRRSRGYGLPRGLLGAALAVAVVALPAAWIALSSDPFREVGPEMLAPTAPPASETAAVRPDECGMRPSGRLRASVRKRRSVVSERVVSTAKNSSPVLLL